MKMTNKWECPFEGIREYPDCFQDCPDIAQCKMKDVWKQVRPLPKLKDAFTLGNEIKERGKRASLLRTSRALKGDTGVTSGEQINIARWLYEARWNGHSYVDEVGKEEILENFCFNVFGATLEETMKAYDTYLG
jgi:hypothetical protein